MEEKFVVVTCVPMSCVVPSKKPDANCTEKEVERKNGKPSQSAVADVQRDLVALLGFLGAELLPYLPYGEGVKLDAHVKKLDSSWQAFEKSMDA